MPKDERRQAPLDQKTSDLNQRLRLRLMPFSPETEVARWNDRSNVRSVEFKNSAPPPYIVFLMFVYFLKFQYWGRSEKVAWEIPVLFQGQSLLLRHQKFGFQILCLGSNPPNEALVQRALNTINKAIPFIEKLAEPLLRQKINEGRMTLNNDFYNLYDRYSFFRSWYIERRSESTGASVKPLPLETPADTAPLRSEGDFNFYSESSVSLEAFNAKIRAMQESSHYAVAAIDAFFSLLEHILVLLAAFLDELPVKPSITQFIGFNWDEKFMLVFDTKNGTKAKFYCDQLRIFKERYRNFFAHGNLQKGGGSILVHVDAVGAIPFTLTRFDNPFHPLFRHLEVAEVDEVFRFFDSVEDFIENAPESRHGYKFIRTGLSVAFDAQSREQYKSAMGSDSEFDSFIDRQIYFADQAINMDW